MAVQFDFLLSQVRTATTFLTAGNVYFYEPGTTTLKDVWLDPEEAVRAANPYTLDANGTAQLYGTGTYRIVIKDAAGVTKFDRDNLYSKDRQRDVYYAEDYISLAAADAAAVADGKLLVISSQWNTVPSALNAAIRVIPGGKINNAGTLTVNGPVEAGSYQVFIGAGAVTMAKTDRIQMRWWWDGSSDATAAIRSALAAGPHVVIGPGDYTVSGTSIIGDPALDYTSDTVNVFNARTLELDAKTNIYMTSTTLPVFNLRSYGHIVGGNIFLPATATTTAGVTVLSTPHAKEWSISGLHVTGQNYTSAAGKGYGVLYDLTNAAAGYIVSGRIDNCTFQYLAKGEYVNATGGHASNWCNGIFHTNVRYWYDVIAVDMPKGDGNVFNSIQIQWGPYVDKHFNIGGVNNVFSAIEYWDTPSTTVAFSMLSTSRNNNVALWYVDPHQVIDLGTTNQFVYGRSAALNSTSGNKDNINSAYSGVPTFYGNQDDILAYADKKYTTTITGNLSYGVPISMFRDAKSEVAYTDVSVNNLVVKVYFGATAVNITNVGFNFFSNFIGTSYVIAWSNDDVTYTPLITETNNLSSRPFHLLHNYGVPMKYLRITFTDGLVANSKAVALLRVYATSNEKSGNLYVNRGGGLLYPPTFANNAAAVTASQPVGTIYYNSTIGALSLVQ